MGGPEVSKLGQVKHLLSIAEVPDITQAQLRADSVINTPSKLLRVSKPRLRVLINDNVTATQEAYDIFCKVPDITQAQLRADSVIDTPSKLLRVSKPRLRVLINDNVTATQEAYDIFCVLQWMRQYRKDKGSSPLNWNVLTADMFDDFLDKCAPKDVFSLCSEHTDTTDDEKPSERMTNDDKEEDKKKVRRKRKSLMTQIPSPKKLLSSFQYKLTASLSSLQLSKYFLASDLFPAITASIRISKISSDNRQSATSRDSECRYLSLVLESW